MAELRTLASGLGLGESVRWHEGRVWCCDWLAGQILVLDEGAGPQVVGRPPVWPFSIDWLPDGRLVVVAGRQLARHDPARIVVHADLSELSAYGFNEIAVDPVGHVFVNNVGFDMMAGEPPAPGIVAVVLADGSSRQVADDVWFPNGMAVAPDGVTLLVAESYAHRITAFTIGGDGSLTDRRVWAELGEAAPDGIACAPDGTVWYADVPHAHCRQVNEGGRVLRTVELDRGCFSCALGGPDGQTLYVAAAEWSGSGGVGEGPRTGVLVAVDL